MRKMAVILLAGIMLMMSLSFIGCGSKENDNTGNGQESGGGYLVLNNYSVTMKEGETFQLDVKKIGKAEDVQQISEIKYSSDAEKVAAADDGGLITAFKKGQTYIHINADGLEAACFVNVFPADVKDGLVISFTTQKLYTGLTAQAYASIFDMGNIVESNPEVIWSVETDNNDPAAKIDDKGVVTGLRVTESVIIKAETEYNNKVYSANISMPVSEPLYYSFEKNYQKLATNKTLSGKDNNFYNTVNLSAKKINLLTNEVLPVSESVSVYSSDDSLVTVTADGSTITLSSGNKGEVSIIGKINSSGETFSMRAEVAIAISDIDDMDKLSESWIEDKDLMADSYILVKDIDYKGQVMLPIAPYIDNLNTRSLGIHWKYWLKLNSDGKTYSYIDREDFGKPNTGLTDDQFFTFVKTQTELVKGFTGTIDGNGHTVKNGQIFYGPGVVSTGLSGGYFSSLIGLLEGTLINISFENITQQDPRELIEKYPDTLGQYIYKVFYKGKGIAATKVDTVIETATDGTPLVRGSSLIAKTNKAKIENVFFSYTMTLKPHQSSFSGGMVVQNEFSSITHCVIAIDSVYEGTRALGTESNNPKANEVKNNLAIGVTQMVFKDTANAQNEIALNECGQWGNWLTASKNWEDLLKSNVGSTAQNVLSLEQTIQSFDTLIWDFSLFNNSDKQSPFLIKGCSVKK